MKPLLWVSIVPWLFIVIKTIKLEMVPHLTLACYLSKVQPVCVSSILPDIRYLKGA